jgi:hypothetical protein
VAIQLSTDAADTILKYLTGVTATTETLKLKLYSNNVNLSAFTDLADFTEVTGGGYAEKNLSVTDWTVSGGVITSTSLLFTFTANIGQIYGYYLVGATSAKLIAFEKFSSGPFNIATNGDTITVTATISVA